MYMYIAYMSHAYVLCVIHGETGNGGRRLHPEVLCYCVVLYSIINVILLYYIISYHII